MKTETVLKVQKHASSESVFVPTELPSSTTAKDGFPLGLPMTPSESPTIPVRWKGCDKKPTKAGDPITCLSPGECCCGFKCGPRRVGGRGGVWGEERMEEDTLQSVQVDNAPLIFSVRHAR